VIQNPRFIFIFQKKFIGELLNKFDMDECNLVSTPMEQNLKLTSKEGNESEDATKYKKLVGSLIYLTTTRLEFHLLLGFFPGSHTSLWIGGGGGGMLDMPSLRLRYCNINVNMKNRR
jgi:hypothetical protein